MNQNYSLQKGLFIPFLFLIFFCLKCKEINSKVAQHSPVELMNSKKDTIINLENGYSLIIPRLYNIVNGMGDDTYFTDIYNEANTIYLQYESKVGVLSNTEKKDLNTIEKKFEKIELLDNQAILLAINFTDNQLRAINGKVFFKVDKQWEEVLLIECHTQKLKTVKNIISTIQSN